MVFQLLARNRFDKRTVPKGGPPGLPAADPQGQAARGDGGQPNRGGGGTDKVSVRTGARRRPTHRRASTCSSHGPRRSPGTRSFTRGTPTHTHLPEEKPGPARRPGRAGAALGEGGLSASSPGATAGGELRRAGSSTTGSSSGLAGPGSWAAASAPKTSLSCLTRRSRLSAGKGRGEDGVSHRAAHPPTHPGRPHSPLDTALLGVWETPGVGDRGSWACLLPATGSAAPG